MNRSVKFLGVIHTESVFSINLSYFSIEFLCKPALDGRLTVAPTSHIFSNEYHIIKMLQLKELKFLDSVSLVNVSSNQKTLEVAVMATVFIIQHKMLYFLCNVFLKILYSLLGELRNVFIF